MGRAITTKLKNLASALRELEPTFNANDLFILMRIAEQPGLRMDEVVRDSGLAASTTSRICARLGDHSVSISGHGLLSAETNQEDFRKRNLYLTPKGQDFIRRLEGTVG